jgi:hypothetical protein
MSCKIDKGIAFDCAAPQQGGAQSFFYVLNYEDWKAATVTIDAGLTEEITGIALTGTGTAGFKFAVPKSGTNLITSSPLRVTDGIDGFDHTVQALVNTIEQLDRDNIERIRFNKVVVIVPLLEGRAKLFGGSVNSIPSPLGVGLRLSEYDEADTDASLGGMIQFTAKTPDNDPPEIKAPQLIASTVDLEALLIPVV